MSERHEMPDFEAPHPENDPMHPTSRRRGLLVLSAVTLIVALLVGIFHAAAPGWGGIFASATPASTFAALPGPRGQWVTVNGISNGTPAIVISSPRVIYELFNDSGQSSGLPNPKRSSDGGATWRVLPIPDGHIQPGSSSTMNTNVRVIPSPTDPNLVFFSVAVPYLGTCPTWPENASFQTSTAGTGSASTLSINLPTSGYGQCSFEYRSTDGGETWQQIALPVGGQLASPVYAQGNRLYSLDQGDRGEQHLVRSDDGGMTWMPIDAEFATGEQGPLPFMPTSTGSTVFAAIAGPDQRTYTLWRSDDTGATWNQVGRLTGIYMSMEVADRAGDATPLLYVELIVPDSTGDTTQFEVSADGGATWTTMPTNGLPLQSQVDQLSLVGELADDSILVQSTSTASDESSTTLIFYSWRVGQSAWRQIAPSDVSAPHYSISFLAITAPDANDHQTLWVIQGYGDGTVQRCVLE